jgi:catechol 2,3-dioxygenase-like lactoylglutathione lyase family enzyme
MALSQAVPLLRVADVARSIEWYRSVLGFVADPFPATPPHEFAILRQGTAELMLRRGSPPQRGATKRYDWDVYLRREGTKLRELCAAFEKLGIVTRRLEQMPYDMAEFEITDPDGYVLCLGQQLDDASDLPTPAE